MSQTKTAGFLNGRKTRGTRKRKKSAKWSNDRQWKRFHERLAAVALDVPGGRKEDHCEVNREAFARRLGISSRKARAWFNGEQWPSADGLRLIAERTDVSVDWLLGLSSVRKLEDRERVGDLARELVLHVVRSYGNSRYVEFGDGLVEELNQPETPEHSANVLKETANFDSGEVVDLSDGGFSVPLISDRGEGNRYLVRNAKGLLDRVTAELVQRADDREERKDRSESDQTRAACAKALVFLASIPDDELAEMFDLPRWIITKELERAFSNPLTDESRQTGRHWLREIERVDQNWKWVIPGMLEGPAVGEIPRSRAKRPPISIFRLLQEEEGQ